MLLRGAGGRARRAIAVVTSSNSEWLSCYEAQRASACAATTAAMARRRSLDNSASEVMTCPRTL